VRIRIFVGRGEGREEIKENKGEIRKGQTL
jgi:hypothetical protein